MYGLAFFENPAQCENVGNGHLRRTDGEEKDLTTDGQQALAQGIIFEAGDEVIPRALKERAEDEAKQGENNHWGNDALLGRINSVKPCRNVFQRITQQIQQCKTN